MIEKQEHGKIDETLLLLSSKKYTTYCMRRNHTQICHPNYWLLGIIIQDGHSG